MAPKSAGAAAADIGKVQELPEITHLHTHAHLQNPCLQMCLCICELQLNLNFNFSSSRATLHAVSTNFTLFWLSWLWWWGIKMRSRPRSRRWSLEIFIGMPRAPGGAKRSHEIHLLLHLYDTNSLSAPLRRCGCAVRIAEVSRVVSSWGNFSGSLIDLLRKEIQKWMFKQANYICSKWVDGSRKKYDNRAD